MASQDHTRIYDLLVDIRDDRHAIYAGHKGARLDLAFKSHQACAIGESCFPLSLPSPPLQSNSTQSPFAECLHAELLEVDSI